MNNCTFIGRLTADVELRYTGSGNAVANFTIAVDRPFTNQSGEKETDFINVVAWRGQAENCAEYIGKGSLVAVNGRLQVESYEDREGVRRKKSEVVVNNVQFLGKRGE